LGQGGGQELLAFGQAVPESRPAKLEPEQSRDKADSLSSSDRRSLCRLGRPGSACKLHPQTPLVFRIGQSGAVKIMGFSPSAVVQLPYLRFHQALYRLSGGLLGKHVGGRPALLLTSKGRRSGVLRTVALIYARRGGDLVVVASNGGSERHPGWYHNVVADPVVSVQIGRRRLRATARTAEGSEREELWALANKNNRGLAPLLHRGASGRYDGYQAHTARTIPVVVLTPDG
jgi:deazaflavin-dependent oxidoreductase (nitroreductase family)